MKRHKQPVSTDIQPTAQMNKPQKTEVKPEIKKIEEEPKNFKQARYSAFVSLWSHHNATQLQWPAVIIGASLLIISNVVPKDTGRIWDWKVGVPLILTGLGILPILYAMNRAHTIMRGLESELDNIEENFGVCKKFSDLNHPPGKSGVKLIRISLMAFSSLMIVSGVLFGFGKELFRLLRFLH